MTTAVFNESELKAALKRKCAEIEIIGGYADTVMNRYGSYLMGKPMPLMRAIIGPSVLVADALVGQKALLHYAVDSYRNGEVLKIRKNNSRW